MKRKVISARTTYSNTPESDKLPEVLHDVSVALANDVMETVRLMASDPIVAGNLVASMPDAEYQRLLRVPA